MILYAIGDSLTLGAYLEGGAWPDRLETWTAVNGAVPGTTAPWWVENLPTPLPPADAAVVMVGSVEAVWGLDPFGYFTHMDALTARLVVEYDTVLVLSAPQREPEYDAILAAYAQSLDLLCGARPELTCVDVFHQLEIEGIHPTAQGQELIADLVEAALPAVPASVPEPGALSLGLVAALLFALVRKR